MFRQKRCDDDFAILRLQFFLLYFCPQMIVMMIWFANAILNNLLDQQFTLGLFLIFRFNSMQIEPLLSSKLIASANAILSSQLWNFATILGFLTEAKNLSQDKKYPKKHSSSKIV